VSQIKLLFQIVTEKSSQDFANNQREPIFFVKWRKYFATIFWHYKWI